MDVKHLAKWTRAAAAIVVAQLSYAEIASARDTSSFYAADAGYALPDHLAYLSLMQNMRHAEREAGQGIDIRHIKDHLAMNDRTAEEFRQFVLASYDEMTEDNTEITQRMLCLNEQALYGRGEAYAVLDVLDDIKETNLKRQLRRAYASFGQSRAEELALWLEYIKAGQTDHRYDRERDFNYDRFSVEELVATACGALASN